MILLCGSLLGCLELCCGCANFKVPSLADQGVAHRDVGTSPQPKSRDIASTLIREGLMMKKVLTGFVVIVFAGLLCTSMISIFSDSGANQHYAGVFKQYPYYMTY